MEEYKKIIGNFIKDIKYMIPVIITALLGFGFNLTHYTVNMDTLSFDRYFTGQELLNQSRFGAVLLNKIFNVMNFNPFFVDFLAVIFLITAAILFCALFKKVSNNKLSPIVYTIFSCFLISYPLIPEIFACTPASLNICLLYSLTAFVLILFNEYLSNKKQIFLISSALILCLVISMYESFAAVLLVGLFMILILKVLYTEKKYTFKEMFLFSLNFIFLLCIALSLNTIIIKCIRSALDITATGFASKVMSYEYFGIVGGLKYLVETTIVKFIAKAFCYVPIAFLLIASILSFIMSIIFSIKRKNFLIFILFVGLIIATHSLSIIQGMAPLYRSCQTFAVFVGFIFMLLAQIISTMKCKSFIKAFLIFIIFLGIFYQVKDLHKWFYVNYMRYEEEKNASLLICNEIEKKYGEDFPVMVIGGMKLSNNINQYVYMPLDTWNRKVYNQILTFFKIDCEQDYYIRIPETNIVASYISWGNTSFGEPSVETIKLFNYLGYDFTAGTVEMYEKSLELSENLPSWPKEGSIIKANNFILVNL